MSAARVLFPKPSPEEQPDATASTFFTAPDSGTVYVRTRCETAHGAPRGLATSDLAPHDVIGGVCPEVCRHAAHLAAAYIHQWQASHSTSGANSEVYLPLHFLHEFRVMRCDDDVGWLALRNLLRKRRTRENANVLHVILGQDILTDLVRGHHGGDLNALGAQDQRNTDGNDSAVVLEKSPQELRGNHDEDYLGPLHRRSNLVVPCDVVRDGISREEGFVLSVSIHLLRLLFSQIPDRDLRALLGQHHRCSGAECATSEDGSFLDGGFHHRHVSMCAERGWKVVLLLGLLLFANGLWSLIGRIDPRSSISVSAYQRPIGITGVVTKECGGWSIATFSKRAFLSAKRCELGAANISKIRNNPRTSSLFTRFWKHLESSAWTTDLGRNSEWSINRFFGLFRVDLCLGVVTEVDFYACFARKCVIRWH
eukprot:306308-Rhodomonas_salina.1